MTEERFHSPLLFEAVHSSFGEGGPVLGTDVSLRDLFATAAVVGMLTEGSCSVEHAAAMAFKIADAMLKERSKT